MPNLAVPPNWAGDSNTPGDKYNSQVINYGNPTNSTLSISNVRTRSATVNYALNYHK